MSTATAPLYAPPPTDRLVTGEDLLRHPEWGPCELIRGKVIKVCRPNTVHGFLTSEISGELRAFAKQNQLGVVVAGDAGVYLERDPDTVRGPDVYFVRSERLGSSLVQHGYLEIAPDLCVEIVSPNDHWSDIEKKVAQYHAIGVKLVWVVDPVWKRVRVSRSSGMSEIVASTGSLSGEEVLPGFKLALSELFSAIPA